MSNDPSPSSGDEKTNGGIEADLWSLDDDLELNSPAPAAEQPGQQSSKLPTRRRKKDTAPLPSRATEATPAPPAPTKIPVEPPSARVEKSPSSIRLAVSQPLAGQNAKGTPPQIAKRTDSETIDDLTAWEDEPELAADPVKTPPAPVEAEDTTAGPEPVPATEEPPAEKPVEAPPAAPVGETAARTWRALTTMEKSGAVALVLILLIIGFFTWRFSINRIPGTPPRAALDLPIKGKHLTVTSVDTWWKLVNNTDGVALGTVVVPGLTMKLENSKGGARIRFRNEEGNTVGDLMTLTVPSSGSMTVSGTAGFKELANHAAYRTDDAKPWTVEVSEAPDAGSPDSAFQVIFSTPVSATMKP